MNQSKALILYAEPNPPCARLMESSILCFKDYNFVHTDSGDKAIELAIQLQPKIILTEMQLVDMSGMTFLKCLQKNNQTKNIPVMGISSYADQKDIDFALESGFATYLTKPFKLYDLYLNILIFTNQKIS